MKKFLLWLVFIVKLGTDIYVNPFQIASVGPLVSQGNKHHHAVVDKNLCEIHMINGNVFISDWSFEKILSILRGL